MDRPDDLRTNDSKKSYAGLTDDALLAALRSEDERAFLEIVKRYQGLVYRYAKHLGVGPEEQTEWATDLMTDVVLSLVKPGAITPSSLGSYFARACRNKAYMAHRARLRRERYECDASVTDSENVSVVASTCSEEQLRAVRGVDSAEIEAPRALKEFVHELAASLTDDEKQMLDWSSEAVPLRLIAEWQGITRDVAAHRLSRLRRRLRMLTPAIIVKFDARDRELIQKVLKVDY